MLTIENDLEPVFDSDGPQSVVDEWEGSIRIYLPRSTWVYIKQALEILDDISTPYDDEGIDVLDYHIDIMPDPDSAQGAVLVAVPSEWEGSLPYNIGAAAIDDERETDYMQRRMGGE